MAESAWLSPAQQANLAAPCIDQGWLRWLSHLSEKDDLVSWDDDIPIWENIEKVETTNQIMISPNMLDRSG